MAFNCLNAVNVQPEQCKRQLYHHRPSPKWWGWLSRMLRWLLWTVASQNPGEKLCGT